MIKRKELLAEKKAALLKNDKSRLVPVILIVSCIGLVLAGVFLYSGENRPSAVGIPAQPDAADLEISYPVDMFDDGRAVHFEYTDGPVSIRYFVLKCSDDVLRAAFDACEVCWRSRKGYYQDGDHMVCRNCGRRFASVLINQVRGGCNPEPLARNIESDRLVIRVEDILAGRKYFNF